MPAAALGIAILKNEVKNPAPSILAASKIVSGTALNVDFRKNYVDGAGQLCDECFVRIYDAINLV